MITADTKPWDGSAIVRDLAIEDYHADMDFDSNSSIQLFKRSRAAYYGQRIKRNIPRPATSNEQRLGSNSSMALLEPEKYHDLLSIVPEDILGANGAKSTKAYKEWVAERPGRVVLTQREADDVDALVQAVDAHPTCRKLLRSCTVFEHSIFWRSEAGHQLKARFDAAAELEAILVDLKTSIYAPVDFWKAVRNYKYECQAALYQDAYQALYGVRPQFKFLVVYKCDGAFEPYVRTMPQDWIDAGRRQNEQTLATLAACKRGELPWVSDGFDIDIELERPPFLIPEEKPEGVIYEPEY